MDIIRIIPSLKAFPLNDSYRAYLKNQLNEQKYLVCPIIEYNIKINKNLASDDKTLYSNIWKLNIDYYNSSIKRFS